MRGSRLRGNDGAFRGDEVCGQCSNQRGHGVRGNCHWFGDETTSRTLNSYSASAPLLPWLAASLPLASPSVVISSHSSTSAARIRSGVIRSGAPPYLGPIWPDSLVTRGGTGLIQCSVASIVFDLLCVAGHGAEFEGLSALKGMVEGVVSNAQRLSVSKLWMGGDARGWCSALRKAFASSTLHSYADVQPLDCPARLALYSEGCGRLAQLVRASR